MSVGLENYVIQNSSEFHTFSNLIYKLIINNCSENNNGEN